MRGRHDDARPCQSQQASSIVRSTLAITTRPSTGQAETSPRTETGVDESGTATADSASCRAARGRRRSTPGVPGPSAASVLLLGFVRRVTRTAPPRGGPWHGRSTPDAERASRTAASRLGRMAGSARHRCADRASIPLLALLRDPRGRSVPRGSSNSPCPRPPQWPRRTAGSRVSLRTTVPPGQLAPTPRRGGTQTVGPSLRRPHPNRGGCTPRATALGHASVQLGAPASAVAVSRSDARTQQRPEGNARKASDQACDAMGPVAVPACARPRRSGLTSACSMAEP